MSWVCKNKSGKHVSMTESCAATPSSAQSANIFSTIRLMAGEADILNEPRPKHPPKLTSRRIGIHTSIAGGVENAAERAYRLGCNTFQIFSSSPRQWAPYELGRPQCDKLKSLREEYNLKPMVIHTNYLINLASITES